MDFQNFLLQFYRIKQSIDDSPSHEAKATYLLLTSTLCFILYILIRPSLPRSCLSIVTTSEVDAIGEYSVPGTFPEEKGEEAVATASSCHMSMGDQSGASNEQADAIKSLQKRLNEKEEELGQAREDVRSTRATLGRVEARAREELAHAQSNHDQRSRRSEAAIAATRDQLTKSRQETKTCEARLAESQRSCSQLRTREEQVIGQRDQLQNHFNQVLVELENAKGELERVSTTTSLSQLTHENCIPRDQVEKLIRYHENLALGTTMRITSGVSMPQEQEDWINRQIDIKFAKKEEELRVLLQKQLKESQDHFDSEYRKLYAEHGQLHVEYDKLWAALNIQPTGQQNQVEKKRLLALVRKRDRSILQLSSDLSQLQKICADKASLIADLSKDRTLVKQIVTEIDSIRKERDLLRQQHGVFVSQAKTQHADKEKVSQDLIKEKELVTKLKEEVQCMNKERSVSQQQMTDLVAKHQKALAEKNSAFEKATKDKGSAIQTKEEIETIMTERNSLWSQLAEAKHQSQYQRDVERNGTLQRVMKIQELQTDLANAAYFRQQTREENSQLKAQLASNASTDAQVKADYDREVNRLTNIAQQLNSELESLKQNVAVPNVQVQSQLANLQQEVLQERLERAKVQSRFDSNLQRLVEANKKIDSLQKSDTARPTSPSATLPPTRVGMISLNTLQAKLREQENTLKGRYHEDLSQQTLTLENKVKELKTTGSSQMANITHLNSQLSQLAEEKANLEWFVNRKDEQIGSHETTISELETQLKQSYKHVEGVTIGFETTRKMLEAKIEELQRQSTNGSRNILGQDERSGRKRDLDTLAKDYDIDENLAVMVQQQETRQTVPTTRIKKSLPKSRIAQRPSTTATNVGPIVPAPRHTHTHLHLSQPSPVPAPGPTPVAPPAKRASAATSAVDKSSLDWELFEGPEPDLAAIVAQDEEKARKEREEEEKKQKQKEQQRKDEDEDDALLVRELNKYLAMEE